MKKLPTIGLFFLGAIPCLIFALYTDHAWEDWFIAFRSAKNLSLGNGLVYEPGQRLQTFTSPINVLIPASLSWICGSGNDYLVLWFQRIISASFLGGTVLLLFRLAKREKYSSTALWFLVALFTLDGKTMDFSICGMESAYVVFFLALSLIAQLEERFVWLGLGWAGLMWSRPDSFIYIGVTALGYILSQLVSDRRWPISQLPILARAAAITTVLYGPWLIWATWYYGSPIPHSIVAKGLGVGHFSIGHLLNSLFHFPKDMLFHDVARSLYMPSYYQSGGWPWWMLGITNILAWFTSLIWIVPKISPLTRTCSFGVFIGLFYLSYFPAFPFPWYFPSILLLASITLAGFLQTTLLFFSETNTNRILIQGFSSIVIILWLCVSLLMSRQIRVQQQVIEIGQRKQIGLWLKEHHSKQKRESVFLEPLGYIGFYSNLKMLDWPGISSPEVVSARRQFGGSWTILINHLKPDWLVLRLKEAQDLQLQEPELFFVNYLLVATFDQSEILKNYPFLPGKGYLEYDQTFKIYQRQSNAP